MRLLLSFTTLQLSAALCAAQAPTVASAPSAAVSGVEAPIGILRAIASDMDQRRDPLYCYFGTRVVAPALRVHIDSVATVAASEACNGIGLAFVMRSTDRVLLTQLMRGVIDGNPRFDVVSVFYGTHDIDRFGDTVRVARSMSMLRGIATLVAHDASPRDGR